MDSKKVKDAVVWCLEDFTWDSSDMEYDITCEAMGKFDLKTNDVKGLQEKRVVDQLMKQANVQKWLRHLVEGFVSGVFEGARLRDDDSERSE